MKVELIAIHEIQTREPRDKEVKVHVPGSKLSVDAEDADRLVTLGAAVFAPAEVAQELSDSHDEETSDEETSDEETSDDKQTSEATESAKPEPAKAPPIKVAGKKQAKKQAKKDLLG